MEKMVTVLIMIVQRLVIKNVLQLRQLLMALIQQLLVVKRLVTLIQETVLVWG